MDNEWNHLQQKLLHRQALRVDQHAAHRLLERLVRVAEQVRQPEAASLGHAIRTKRLEPLALLEASMTQAAEPLAVLAAEADLDAGIVAALGQLLAWPLLLACGDTARPLLDGVPWEAGYCPVCAAWPTMAELRGLDGARWPYLHGRCVYCGNTDHRTQGYLAPEAEREARRAVTCDACQGYLKTVTSFGPIPPTELALQDLATLELDLAAVERGYGRLAAPGFALQVTIAGVEGHAAARWIPWRR
jgi:FdhE protein